MKGPLLIGFLLFGFLSFSQDWQTDLEIAKSISAEQNRKIILVFQGSDWCAPCIKLDREVWSTEEFIAYSNEHYVMLKADFPRKKKNVISEEQSKKNQALAEMYNKRGFFPHVLVLDSLGNVLGETGYEKLSPAEYITLLNSF